MEEQLHLTREWDKTFPQNSSVEHRKVTFHNRYGITLAADLYRPKGAAGPLPALAVCGPFGAVKEQASGLYAQEMARRGFLTILTRWSPSSASTWSETGKKVPSSRHVRMDGTHTGKFGAESVRAALRRVRGPQGDTRGKEFLSRICGQKWVPPGAWRAAIR